MLSSPPADGAFSELICKVLFEEEPLEFGRDVRLPVAARHFDRIVAVAILVSDFLGKMAVQPFTEIVDFFPSEAFKRRLSVGSCLLETRGMRGRVFHNGQSADPMKLARDHRPVRDVTTFNNVNEAM